MVSHCVRYYGRRTRKGDQQNANKVVDVLPELVFVSVFGRVEKTWAAVPDITDLQFYDEVYDEMLDYINEGREGTNEEGAILENVIGTEFIESVATQEEFYNGCKIIRDRIHAKWVLTQHWGENKIRNASADHVYSFTKRLLDADTDYADVVRQEIGNKLYDEGPPQKFKEKVEELMAYSPFVDRLPSMSILDEEGVGSGVDPDLVTFQSEVSRAVDITQTLGNRGKFTPEVFVSTFKQVLVNPSVMDTLSMIMKERGILCWEHPKDADDYEGCANLLKAIAINTRPMLEPPSTDHRRVRLT